MLAIDHGKRCYGLQYLINGPKFTFDARDNVEKYVEFYHKGKFYKYGSAIPNFGMMVQPGRKKTVRAETNVKCIMMYRTPDQFIKHIHLSQVDFKVEIPSWLLKSFLPDAAKKWVGEAKKYYLKNYKKEMQKSSKKITSAADDDSRKILGLQ